MVAKTKLALKFTYNRNLNLISFLIKAKTHIRTMSATKVGHFNMHGYGFELNVKMILSMSTNTWMLFKCKINKITLFVLFVSILVQYEVTYNFYAWNRHEIVWYHSDKYYTREKHSYRVLIRLKSCSCTL